MRFGFRIPSLSKRIAARTSVKRFVRQNLGMKAPRGLGWLTNPKKALYNRIYTRTTRGCLLHIILLIFGFVLLFSRCDLRPKRERPVKPVYVKPTVDYRGKFKKGHVRMPVSTNKNALRNQAKSKYYYQTRGKYKKR